MFVTNDRIILLDTQVPFIFTAIMFVSFCRLYKKLLSVSSFKNKFFTALLVDYFSCHKNDYFYI